MTASSLMPSLHLRLPPEGARRLGALPVPIRRLGLAVLVGGIYLGLAEGAALIAGAVEPAFFPAAGLTLGICLLTRRSAWPVIMLAVASAELGLDLAHGLPLGTSAGLALANAVEPVVGALVFLHLSRGDVRLREPGDLTRLVAAGVASTALSALLGTFALATVGGQTSWWPTFAEWWSGDAIGQLVVVPVLLLLAGRSIGILPERPRLEACLGLGALMGSCVGVFVFSQAAVAYFLVASVLCGGLRFGTLGATVAGVVSTAGASFAMSGDYRIALVPGGNAAQALLLADVFLGATLLCAHLLATEIQSRRLTEGRLRENEEQFRALIERSPLGISLIDPRDGIVMSWNPAAERVFGWTAGDVIGQRLPTIPEEEWEAHGDVFRRIAEHPEGYAVEGARLRPDGTSVWVRTTAAPIHDEAGRVWRFVGIHEDISERKALELQLVHQSQHDSLTGLPNRSFLVARLDHALRLQARLGGALAVLFCDVDRFKVVNDSLGHQMGDELLVETSRRIADIVCDTDTIARHGGDEFVVVAEQIDGPRGAVELARRLGDALAEPFLLAGRELRVGASIGIALAADEATSEELIRSANSAMHRAKDGGGGRYEIFDEAMRAWADIRLDTELALRQAIRRDELRVHFQPTVSLEDGSISSAEALVRWEREGQMVSPATFIPLAEELGLIVAIGSWVLTESCERLAEWRRTLGDAAPRKVAVNVSPRQLMDPTLPSQVASLLIANGLEPGALCLEITESVMLQDAEVTLATLEALRELGVRLAIDDFGTGYSSLSYLRRLPVHILKIDRGFLLQLGVNPNDATIIGAVIDLAHSLGLEVVAEGIETEAQLAELRRLGCDHVQGFLVARPMPDADLRGFLAARPGYQETRERLAS